MAPKTLIFGNVVFCATDQRVSQEKVIRKQEKVIRKTSQSVI
jgi:hypothetical protein